jgi:pimeloyl-[acyl-carrier protein] methyl ester esterase
MTQIRIQTWGAGQDALVLFHGWGFDSDIWLSFIPLLHRFTDATQIIAVDLPGFGLTPCIEWEVFKNELLQRLPENNTLLGWSLGGLFATRFAIEVPGRVKKLINVATSPYFIRDTGWPGVDYQQFDAFYYQFQRDPERTRAEFIASQMGSAASKTLNQSAMRPRYIKEDNGLLQGLQILQQWDLRQELQTIKIPTTYIFGRLDSIVPHRVRLVMQTQYPEFNYHLLAHAAHIPFLSHPQELLAVLPLA